MKRRRGRYRQRRCRQQKGSSGAFRGVNRQRGKRNNQRGGFLLLLAKLF